jgi:ribokinase
VIKNDCVGLGIIVLDHLITVERYPVSNSKNILKSHHQQGGGPVPTALAVLGTMGKSTSLIAKLDDDYQAKYLVKELHDFNVDTDFVVHDERIDTPEAFVIIDERNGDRTVLLNRRKEANLMPQDVPVDLIKNSAILHMDGQEADAAIFAAKVAHEHDVKVSIDIGSDRYIPKELLDLVDIAIVSESFADAQLVKNNPLKSAEKLLSLGPKIGGVTCGERGSYFAAREASFHQPAFPINVVDSTGAGDVFHGSALFGYLQNYTLRQTAQFASATAALACTKTGGKAGIPSVNEIVALLKKNNINSDFINGG